MATAVLKAMGGQGAIVVTIDPAKRQAALDAGAIAVVDSKAPDAAKQLIELTKGGVCTVLDLVGATPPSHWQLPAAHAADTSSFAV